MNFRTLLILCAIAAAGFAFYEAPKDAAGPARADAAAPPGDAVLAQAFEARAGDIQVTVRGRVIKVLPDDTSGSRHQRFLLRLASGQTVLVAHNIDLAPRVPGLAEGDAVSVHGEYEWNEKGGVIHWTHRDPQGRHEAGWIRHGDKILQ